ncbi:sugar transferase [Streptomyces sp. A3M-1-3]|uniref:sugar transferase n=1 Tax=Streptomyces sp. A3M-1-3 TaxID=2962044 RepID=UPI0020B80850|nr:sugar transferase [Streptomyces sp. A3M-1-3]MCP3822521.1 sugar transferase [Streptomyces sp. A3M-1-3]
MRAKRALDAAGSLALLLILAPLLILLTAASVATSAGPPFTRRTAAGLYGRPFETLKFRIAPTPLGRLLDRYALDELPQLVNVLRGEMSLVGPRPLPARDPACTVHRLEVRPGITGLWQVGARSDLPWEEMSLLDLHYIEHHWLGMDLAILVRTVPAALRPRRSRLRVA